MKVTTTEQIVPMSIAVVGTGSVGATLGTRWAKLGHRVTFCSRFPGEDKVTHLVKEAGENAKAATLEAAVQADVVLLATPGISAVKVAASIKGLAGKIVIDCTNPVKPDLSGLVTSGDGSEAEQIAKAAPGSRVVKAFNTIHFETMEDPVYGHYHADALICGDDYSAKEVVKKLAHQLGFEPIDAGPLSNALHLEHMAMLWMQLAFKHHHGHEFIFKILNR